ncbi:hypothetical protein DOTSEDRAFT_28923 [Dothistroma septosporum NZE10]|uniref:BTB domain-containing protein n=1 Tax=Dothistroma septosporum (strain NZE10 / CBS 128990) TaxID=675120 RepID=M2YID5_DOTSN|nr:hypothetical protein DOTSEDRAFT_28923 [Dothistroma septosporum NZE10]
MAVQVNTPAVMPAPPALPRVPPQPSTAPSAAHAPAASPATTLPQSKTPTRTPSAPSTTGPITVPSSESPTPVAPSAIAAAPLSASRSTPSSSAPPPQQYTLASTTKRPSDGETVPAKRFKSSYFETITILVGKAEDKFLVHKATICARSPYFAAACSMKWEQGQEGVVRLPNHSPKAFDMIVHWLYTDTLDLNIVELDWHAQPLYHVLVCIWRQAHHYQLFDLCNKTVDCMFARHRKFPDVRPSSNSLIDACALVSESGARRPLVDVAVWTFDGPAFDQLGAQLPKEVLLAVTRKLMAGEQKQDSNPVRKPRCHYHNHSEGDTKCTWDR